MGSTQKKVYELLINGVTKDITDVTTLNETLISLNTTVSKTNAANKEFTAGSAEKTKALNEEEKAVRKLAQSEEDQITKLTKLNKNIDYTISSAKGVGDALSASISIIQLFGEESKKGSEVAKDLAKVMNIIKLAGEVNNNLIKNSILLKMQDTAAEKAKAGAMAGTAAATKGATAATSLFSKALTSTGVGALIVGLGMLIANLDNLKKLVLENIPALEKFGPLIDDLIAKFMGVANAVKNYVLAPVKAIATTINTLIEKDLKTALKEGAKVYLKNLNIIQSYQEGYEKQTLENAKNIAKKKAKIRIEELDNEIKNNLAQCGSDWKYSAEAREAYKQLFEAKRILYQDDKEARQNAQREEWEYINMIKKYDEDVANRAAQDAKARAKEAGERAKERARNELDAVRAAEDAKIELTADADEKARLETAKSYDRQIEDLRIKLREEENLTPKAREAINQTILSLEKAKENALNKLKEEKAKERAEADLAITKQIETLKTAAILDSYERRRTEVNAKYDLQLKDLQSQLDKEKEVMGEGQEKITELITLNEKARQKELTDIALSEMDKRNSLELAQIEACLEETKDIIGTVEVRDKTGLQLIDVDKTRENLARTNQMLKDYVTQLESYQIGLAKTKQEALAKFKEGSPEYEEALQKYAAAERKVAKQIKDSQKEQAENTEKSKNLLFNYYKELSEKISKYADMGVQAVKSLTAALNASLDMQLEDLKKQTESINAQQAEAQKQREESVKRIEKLENDLQTATGGTAEVLKEQLQNEMLYRTQAQAKEQELAREKEKNAAEIAKKEKQKKRSEMVSNIAQAIANIAQGITKAFSYGPILGAVMATIVGAAGAVQIGIMTKQLSKMADGGIIEGPSHAQGGARIQGTNIEVEGGEFVINKASTAANTELLSFINNARGAVSMADLAGVIPGNNVPVIINEISQTPEDRILEAISNIEFSPVVSVVDIIDTTDEVVTVRDLSGF